MTALSLLAVSLVMKFVAVLFVLCSVALILVVLIQKGKGSGLTGALGGGMAGGILGSKTGDFLTWFTIAMAGLFLTLAVVMVKFYKPSVSDFDAVQVPPPASQPMQSGRQPIPALPGQADDVADTNKTD